MMYILYRGTSEDEWQPVGFFAEFPEAVCAMEEELRKKDGQRMKIERDGEDASQNAM